MSFEREILFLVFFFVIFFYKNWNFNNSRSKYKLNFDEVNRSLGFGRLNV